MTKEEECENKGTTGRERKIKVFKSFTAIERFQVIISDTFSLTLLLLKKKLIILILYNLPFDLQIKIKLENIFNINY